MQTLIGRFPTAVGHLIVAVVAVGGLSACAVGDGVAHVVKLGVQAAQGSDGPSDHPNAPQGTAPKVAPPESAQTGDDRPDRPAPPPLPVSAPVAPVAEESLPPVSKAKP
jgi:hypothetical protein